MTKKIQEIALSIFLATCSTSLIMGMLWLKPVLESQRLLIEETRKNQEQIIKSAEETKTIVAEIGYSLAVFSMMKEGIIKPADGNKMIEKSVVTIEAQSERLGELAKLANEFRINN